MLIRTVMVVAIACGLSPETACWGQADDAPTPTFPPVEVPTLPPVPSSPGEKDYRPPPQTEVSIDLGLRYLASVQQDDGRWSLQTGNNDGILATDTAATGLALLAFLGAGHNHREFKYAENIRKGIDYLVKNQVSSRDLQKDGDLFSLVPNHPDEVMSLYSHAIATFALCEAYTMTADPALKKPAQRALNFIVNTQNKTRGGWRYTPRTGSDLSVTVWMTMALASGDDVGLDVPDQTFERIRSWLDRCQKSDTERHLYRYNPFSPDTPEQRHGRVPSKAMTAAGLTARLCTGWDSKNEHFKKGADYVVEHAPRIGTKRMPERDVHYWFFGTMVAYPMSGRHWEAWNEKLHPLLVESQTKSGELAGSWDPARPVPDRWGPHAGRFYVTTMSLLCLEVYYRHLPFYAFIAN